MRPFKNNVSVSEDHKLDQFLKFSGIDSTTGEQKLRVICVGEFTVKNVQKTDKQMNMFRKMK